MNDVQIKLKELNDKGWTSSAIADELGVTNVAVYRWQSGDRYPENIKPILIVLDQLMRRKNIPKRRRVKKQN